jgi:hypothetical protein
VFSDTVVCDKDTKFKKVFSSLSFDQMLVQTYPSRCNFPLRIWLATMAESTASTANGNETEGEDSVSGEDSLSKCR